MKFKFNKVFMSEDGGDNPGGAAGGMMGDPGAGDGGATGAGDPGASTWSYADDVVGAGDRPEWFKEKYNSVADQAKAYGDLEKRFGGFTGSPDEYAAIDGVATDGETGIMAATIRDIAKDANMDQDTYEKIVKGVIGNIDGYRETFEQEQMQEAIKSIPNFETRRSALADTIQTVLTADQFTGLNSLMKTAEGFEAVEQLAAKIRGGALPGVQGIPETRSSSDIMGDVNKLDGADLKGRAKLLAEMNKAGDGVGKLV